MIAYSQGTAATLYGMSSESKALSLFKDKVNAVFLLAPAVYFSQMEVEVLNKLA